jgi:hypothetical protein
MITRDHWEGDLHLRCDNDNCKTYKKFPFYKNFNDVRDWLRESKWASLNTPYGWKNLCPGCNTEYNRKKLLDVLTDEDEQKHYVENLPKIKTMREAIEKALECLHTYGFYDKEEDIIPEDYVGKAIKYLDAALLKGNKNVE